MLMLGIDLETTGLNKDIDKIIEVGVVVFSPFDWSIWTMHSWLVHQKVPEHIRDLTGISQIMLDKNGQSEFVVANKLVALINHFKINSIVAHNAPFDIGFLKEFIKQLPEHSSILDDKLIIDTKIDLPYKKDMGQGDLTRICAKHGFLNPFAHRAVFDVLSMIKVMSNYNIEEITFRAKSPNVTLVSDAPFSQKEEVKKAGFYWKPATKTWERLVKQCDIEDFKNSLPFEVTIVP
jgi:DNA polymerase III alpha subunit (gram-positive type)